MLKIYELSEWEAFLGVAAYGGFSEASRHLRVPLSQISKRVARLESQLNTRLFQRTTRVVTLTDEGKALVPKIESILEDLREAESLFENRHPLSGNLKVTCAPFVAHKLVLPILGEFMALHPKIHIELDLSERLSNIIEEGFDMAIRIETPKDSDLIYKKLVPNNLVFCAAPSYLKAHKAPLTTPTDLHNHDLLMLSMHRKCRFQSQDQRLGEFEKSKKLTCENGVFLTDMALKGYGVLVRSIWDVQDHLKSGKLVQLLRKHPLDTFGHIHAVIPGKRFLAPRVRAFSDFVVLKSKAWKHSV